jgi:predicted RecB family nuclease
VAKYDLVAIKNSDGSRSADQALILDWKTYRKRPRDEWLASRLQTRVYRTLLVKSGSFLNNGVPLQPEQLGMVYWFADFPNEPARFKYDITQFNRDWEALSKLIEEIESAAEYPKTTDLTRCSYCPFRSYCGRGSQAGAYEDLDSEMEAEELFDIHFEQIGEIAF